MQRIIRLWSNLRISSKIALVSALCSAAGLLILTTVMVHIMTDHMLEQGKAELQMRVDQLVDLATLEHDMLEQKLRGDLRTAELEFARQAGDDVAHWEQKLTFDDSKPHAIGDYTLPEMRLNGHVVSENFELVDRVLDETGSTCTMFQVTPDRWVRISTNVKKSDGSRAIGTTLDANSPVYNVVLSGKTYYGSNMIQGKRYQTAYAPLKDASGKLVAVLYVGVPHDQFTQLRETVKSIKIGKTGYPYVMDGTGVLVIHPAKEGSTLAVYDFGKEMVAKRSGFVEYPWEGRNKLAAYAYYEPFDWIIAASTYDDEFTADIRSLKWIARFIALGLILAAAGLCWFTGRLIGKGVVRVTDAIRDIAEGEGDLTRRLEVTSNDETGELARHFNTFVDRVHHIIRDIAQASREVASAAAEVSSSSEEMTSGLRRQLDQTRNVAASVEQMTASIADVAQRSEQASEQSQHAGQCARKGGEVVRQTIDGIHSIDQIVQDSAAVITRLGQRGDEIGQIIGVINDIAEQTNLLALNAAIEAARAGEHGRGFSVVADEVRKLADRTTRATEEIAESIKTIQSDTSTAVGQMQTGAQRVNEGTALAGQAGESLKAIVSGSDEVAGMIQAIAAAAEEQSVTSKQIAQAVEQIATVSEQSRDGSRQATAAAEELTRKSEQLHAIVEQFKI